MKNNSEVCKATAGGFMEYEGLPGYVTTGCQRTPAFKSRFCSMHNPRACTLTSLEGDSDDAEKAVVAMILEKKVTRKNTYY